MPRDPKTGRVRDPVKRTGKRFRVKFPSQKLGRMVQCESILERDAALLLEHLPFVAAYQEQPERIVYCDEHGRSREYVPDFRAVTTTEETVDIEVKPADKLKDPKLRRKLRAIARQYADQGKRFRIWTEKWIRQEPRLSTLRTIHQHAKPGSAHVTAEAAADALGKTASCSVAEASRRLGGSTQVLALVAADVLRVNFERTLDDEALVWLKNFDGGHHAAICL